MYKCIMRSKSIITATRIIVLIKQQTYIIHEIYFVFHYSSKSSINGTAIHLEICFLFSFLYYWNFSTIQKRRSYDWYYYFSLGACAHMSHALRIFVPLKIYECA